jgi:hypothetical protein
MIVLALGIVVPKNKIGGVEVVLYFSFFLRLFVRSEAQVFISITAFLSSHAITRGRWCGAVVGFVDFT